MYVKVCTGINETVVKTILSKNLLYVSGLARVANYSLMAALLQLTLVATKFNIRNDTISDVNEKPGNTLSYAEKPWA